MSVILPTYNSKLFLRNTIGSIVRQDYKNLELIVIDDGSTDETCQLIQSLKDPRIRFYQNRKNRGIAYTRTRGLKLARGKYITFFDHDDVMLPHAIKKRVSFLEKNRKANVVFGYSKILWDRQKSWAGNASSASRARAWIQSRRQAQKKGIRFVTLYKQLDHALLIRFYCFYTLFTNLMLRKSFARKIGALNRKFKVCDDTDFVQRAIQQAPFHFLNSPVKAYRIHGRNASLRLSYKELAREWSQISKQHLWRPHNTKSIK